MNKIAVQKDIGQRVDDTMQFSMASYDNDLSAIGIFFSALLGIALAQFLTLEFLTSLSLFSLVIFAIFLGSIPLLISHIGKLCSLASKVFDVVIIITLIGFLIFAIFTVFSMFPMYLQKLVNGLTIAWIILSVILGLSTGFRRRRLYQSIRDELISEIKLKSNEND